MAVNLFFCEEKQIVGRFRTINTRTRVWESLLYCVTDSTSAITLCFCKEQVTLN